MTPSVDAWRTRGRSLEVCGLSVFVVDAGPRDATETALVLHGFPTSSHDFHQVLPLLEERRRIVLLDLPGYGLSAKPASYSYSLFEQTDVVLAVLRELGVARCHVVAHDMGTSVACELVARRERGLLPIELVSLVLSNGSVHIELAHLTPSQKILLSPAGKLLARIGSGRVFAIQMGRILGRPLPDEALRDMWVQLVHNDGRARLPQTIGYVRERRRFWHRWIGALTRLDIPTLVLWGTLDPVAVFAIAERLASEIPGARLEPLEGLGHYPQLEDPERTAQSILRFWDGQK